jgi:hypothetical protein
MRGRLFSGEGHRTSIELEHYFGPRIWYRVTQHLHGFLYLLILGGRNLYEELHIQVPGWLAFALYAFAP